MRNPNPPRPGFTLIELLTIIAIVGVLMALTAGAAFRLMGASATGATRTLLTRLETRLRQQWTYKADRAREAVLPDIYKILSGAVVDTSSPTGQPRYIGGNQDLARAIYVKVWLKAHFPMSFNEALNPAGGLAIDNRPGVVNIVPVRAYVRFLAEHGITSGGNPPEPHESAVCLYMALMHGQETTSDKDTGLAGAVRPLVGSIAGHKPAPGFVDAWGQPLVFCPPRSGPRRTSPARTLRSTRGSA